MTRTGKSLASAKSVAIMRNEGIAVSEEMIRSLMKEIGSIRQTSRKLYEDECKKHNNYVNQQFDTQAPNEVWVSDVTYFKFNDKAYHICVILDLLSRKVISYKVSKNNSTQLVTSTLKALTFVLGGSKRSVFIFSASRFKLFRKKSPKEKRKMRPRKVAYILGL